jgi:type II secretory pathway component GspD/PulD (secretin)
VVVRTVPKPLDTVESYVTTVATIPNGATIILGGIEKITQNKSVTKIPILGDIPIIGLLFRGIDKIDAQTKLYVFVKAHIIKPADALTGYSDIERISFKKRRAYEEAETMFQGLQSIPGIKPDPMDPLRILEEDEPLK